MNATASFIKDRALSLAYEAVRFPAGAGAALAWIDLAISWAEERGLEPLREELMNLFLPAAESFCGGGFEPRFTRSEETSPTGSGPTGSGPRASSLGAL